MAELDLRDADLTRQFLLQGLWLQRVLPPLPETTQRVLGWCHELVSGGEGLPSVGLVADVGHEAFGLEPEGKAQKERLNILKMLESLTDADRQLIQHYENHVIGRLRSDSSFSRGSDGLAGFQGDRDRSRGLAFVLTQIRERADYPRVMLSPGVIKGLLQEKPVDLLAEGYTSLEQDGLMPLLKQLYEQLILQVRNTGDVLGPEDIFELEHGTALAEFGQRLAMRQVLGAANELEARLPVQPVHSLARRQQVPTHILDEDSYPIGGFTSISNRGSVESLLHSQLAFMERDDRPDLFDIKFLRDELLYYSRDENQFLRRRRTFLFILYPDLVLARVKDAGADWQRIVMTWATLYVAVRKLIDWLANDALNFEFLFLPPTKEAAEHPLQDEIDLFRMLLKEQIENQTVAVEIQDLNQIAERAAIYARRSLCHCLLVSAKDQKPLPVDGALFTRLPIQATPEIGIESDDLEKCPGHDSADIWRNTLLMLLRTWLQT